jgi:hypothetical protein
MFYLLILPSIAFGIVADHATFWQAALCGCGALVAEVLVIIFIGRREEQHGSGLETTDVRASSYRLNYEPDVIDMGTITLKACVEIKDAKAELIEQLVACGALVNSLETDAVRYSDLLCIREKLLGDLCPDSFDNLKFVVWLVAGHYHLTSATGTFEQIQRELDNFLARPSGRLGVAQERGDFIDGRFFTDDTYVHVCRDYLSTQLVVAAISRAKLSAAVQGELDTLATHLSRKPAA